jgi:hypothetical protein
MASDYITVIGTLDRQFVRTQHQQTYRSTSKIAHCFLQADFGSFTFSCQALDDTISDNHKYYHQVR